MCHTLHSVSRMTQTYGMGLAMGREGIVYVREERGCPCSHASCMTCVFQYVCQYTDVCYNTLCEVILGSHGSPCHGKDVSQFVRQDEVEKIIILVWGREGVGEGGRLLCVYVYFELYPNNQFVSIELNSLLLYTLIYTFQYFDTYCHMQIPSYTQLEARGCVLVYG